MLWTNTFEYAIMQIGLTTPRKAMLAAQGNGNENAFWYLLIGACIIDCLWDAARFLKKKGIFAGLIIFSAISLQAQQSVSCVKMDNYTGRPMRISIDGGYAKQYMAAGETIIWPLGVYDGCNAQIYWDDESWYGTDVDFLDSSTTPGDIHVQFYVTYPFGGSGPNYSLIRINDNQEAQYTPFALRGFFAGAGLLALAACLKVVRRFLAGSADSTL